MLKHFDHLTIVVRDIQRAMAFFGVLGFKEATSVIISGEPFATYLRLVGLPIERFTFPGRTMAPNHGTWDSGSNSPTAPEQYYFADGVAEDNMQRHVDMAESVIRLLAEDGIPLSVGPEFPTKFTCYGCGQNTWGKRDSLCFAATI
jgi:catechol 2,3-dioxygenase-like lactoylglutathione lyase family enzyme